MPSEKKHPADELVVIVPVAPDAGMTVPNPYRESGMVWTLKYGNALQVRHSAASVIESFSYLLSNNITASEAARRLRVLRKALASSPQPTATNTLEDGHA